MRLFGAFEFRGQDGGFFFGGDDLLFVIDPPGAVEELSDLDLGLGEPSSALSGRDLDDDVIDLDGIVVGDGCEIAEGEDGVEVESGRFSEEGFRLGWGPGELGVVPGEEVGFDPGVGGFGSGDVVEFHFGDESVLEGFEFSFDPSLGLGGIGGDCGDAEFLEGHPDLGWVLLSADLFFEGPVVVVSVEGSVLVVVDGDGDTGFGDDVFEGSHVSDGCFGGFEVEGEDVAGGVVDGGHEAGLGLVLSEPLVVASVPLDHGAEVFLRWSSLVMAFGSSFIFGFDSGGSSDFADGFSAEDDGFVLAEHLGEVGVVELAVFVLGEFEDGLDGLRIGFVWRNLPAGLMRDLGGSTQEETGFESFGLPIGHSHCYGCLFQAHSSVADPSQNASSLQFPLTQLDIFLHRGHFSLAVRGDILGLLPQFFVFGYTISSTYVKLKPAGFPSRAPGPGGEGERSKEVDAGWRQAKTIVC